MTEPRSSLSAATQAALWVLSSGTCYAPGCSFPVIVEVRPGFYKKNAQIAHIHGVKGPRKIPNLTKEQRESFSNLMLLCLAHHSEIDDINYGEKLYPATLLREWKAAHEGNELKALSALQVPNEEDFLAYLEHVFEPPLKRLEDIAAKLEKTGTLNAQSVTEMQQIIRTLTTSSVGIDRQTVLQLGNVADMFTALRLDNTANKLLDAADAMNARRRP